jgi:murein DD-endopeptidase MepM/ murein hydrolase activator NlpD
MAPFGSDQVPCGSCPARAPGLRFPREQATGHRWTGGPHGITNTGAVCKGCGTAKVPITTRSGLDFGTSDGEWEIHAMAGGQVVHGAGDGKLDGALGYGVVVDHGDGWMTVYAHMKSTGLRRRGSVARADVLGTTGCTGSGCKSRHLHVVLRYGTGPWDKRAIMYWDGREIDGWRIYAGEQDQTDPLNYDGHAVKGDEVVTAEMSGGDCFYAGTGDFARCELG